MAQAPDDYDTPWKDAITRYFPDFMAFFFPQAHREIDWGRPHVFLDQELAQLARDGELGKRLADRLVRVHTHDGGEQWVLIHLEVQGKRERDFAERIFSYHYRAYDRFRRPVASLVLLADDSPRWRPHRFTYQLFGCQLRLDFSVVKLRDYAPRLEQLLAQSNPFGLVTAAHLLTRRTGGDAARRHAAKLRLARLLYARDWDKQRIIDLYLLIDWMMRLPSELERVLWRDIQLLEKERTMRYVSSVEKIGIELGREEGLREGRQEGREEGRKELLALLIESRFGSVPPAVRERLAAADSAELDGWARKLFSGASLDDVFAGA